MYKHKKYVLKMSNDIMKGGAMENINELTKQKLEELLGEGYYVHETATGFIIYSMGNNSVSLEIDKNKQLGRVKYLNDYKMPANENEISWPSGNYTAKNTENIITAIKNGFYRYNNSVLSSALTTDIQTYFKALSRDTTVKELNTQEIQEALTYCFAPATTGDIHSGNFIKCEFVFDKIFSLTGPIKGLLGILSNKFIYHKAHKELNPFQN